MQQPSIVDVTCRERQAEMLQRVVSADDQAATEMNDLLEWATRNQITTSSQKHMIAKELRLVLYYLIKKYTYLI